MIHFTMTGPWAGRPYCGQERRPQDKYFHVPYNPQVVAVYLAQEGFCPDCKAVYEKGLLEDEVEKYLRELSFQEMDGGFTEDEIEYLLDQDAATLTWFKEQPFYEIKAWLETRRHPEFPDGEFPNRCELGIT